MVVNVQKKPLPVEVNSDSDDDMLKLLEQEITSNLKDDLLTYADQNIIIEDETVDGGCVSDAEFTEITEVRLE